MIVFRIGGISIICPTTWLTLGWKKKNEKKKKKKKTELLNRLHSLLMDFEDQPNHARKRGKISGLLTMRPTFDLYIFAKKLGMHHAPGPRTWERS